MMRIVFLIPKTKDHFGTPSTPHVGVSALAAYVRACGHDPYVIDMRVERFGLFRLRRRLEELKPEFVAVTSTSLKYKEVYSLVNDLSGWGWRVIYGGSHVSTVREDIFDGCTPYAAVYGEGEKALSAILADKDIGSIRGVMYLSEGGEVITNPPGEGIEDLDSLPFPAYELSKMHLYAEKKIPLITSRECPCRCSYCTVKLVMGGGFRARSPENVIAEIERWYKEGYRLFGINDDNFTADMGRVEKICDLLMERKLEVAWELRTGVRIDRVNEALLTKMKSAGCIFLAFGIEAIDDSVLLAAKKGVTFSQIKVAIAAAERVGIPFSGFFMIGLPGDTFAKFLELYRFVLSCHFEEVRFYNLGPYPNTEVLDWIRKNGRMLASPEEYLNESSLLKNRPFFETDDFSFQERLEATYLGEYMVVNKLLVKTLGASLGEFVSVFARQRHIRSLIFYAGFRLVSVIRKRHLRTAGPIMDRRANGKC